MLDCWDYNSLFIKLCVWNDLNALQILYKIKPSINTSSKNYFAFRYVCANGHLNIVKWLITIIPNIISEIYEDVFISACSEGHTDIAKYLLEVNPNINIYAKYFEAFVFACAGGHLELAQWYY
jgi:ankyrin repeat protein